MPRLIWGAAEIGKLIGRDAKFVYYQQATGHLKSLRKVGRLIVADRDALLQEITGRAPELPTAREMLDQQDERAA